MKYWYLYFETGKTKSWRIWVGDHPLDRLALCPDQVPMFWQEVPQDAAERALKAHPKIAIEDDHKTPDQKSEDDYHPPISAEEIER